MKALRVIGYWRNDAHPEYPDPHDLVDESWDEDSRNALGAYLTCGLLPWAGMGRSPCRICGKPNGAAEFSDGVYVWPEGLAHYVEDHFVRLPLEVEQHMLDRMRQYDDPVLDHDWWVGATQPPGR